MRHLKAHGAETRQIGAVAADALDEIHSAIYGQAPEASRAWTDGDAILLVVRLPATRDPASERTPVARSSEWSAPRSTAAPASCCAPAAPTSTRGGASRCSRSSAYRDARGPGAGRAGRRRAGARRWLTPAPAPPPSAPVLGIPLAVTDYDAVRRLDRRDGRVGRRGTLSAAAVHLVMRAREDPDVALRRARR